MDHADAVTADLQPQPPGQVGERIRGARYPGGGGAQSRHDPIRAFNRRVDDELRIRIGPKSPLKIRRP